MRRIFAIMRKELLHILRDPRSLVVAILMPLGMVIIFGYAIDMDLKQLKVAVIDLDRSHESRDLIREMTSSGFIVVSEYLDDRSQIETGFRQRRFRAALIIPKDYSRSLQKNTNTPIQVLIDGADGTTASTVDNYLAAVLARVNQRLVSETIGANSFPIDPELRIYFNPQLVSANFVVPGLVAIIMIMICALLTSIAIAREKETGTMEQVLTTPVRPSHVIIGKVIPYMAIGAIDATLVLLVGRFIFGVPNNGSWLVLAGYCLLYLFIALSLGLLISTVAKSQQIAMMIALMATMLPTIMLSGFIFTVASMPWPLQILSKVIPATHFLIIIRGVMLKGELWYPVQGGIMLLMAVVIVGIAIKRFKGRLD